MGRKCKKWRIRRGLSGRRCGAGGARQGGATTDGRVGKLGCFQTQHESLSLDLFFTEAFTTGAIVLSGDGCFGRRDRRMDILSCLRCMNRINRYVSGFWADG
jgi:hypothetical protein